MQNIARSMNSLTSKEQELVSACRNADISKIEEILRESFGDLYVGIAALTAVKHNSEEKSLEIVRRFAHSGLGLKERSFYMDETGNPLENIANRVLRNALSKNYFELARFLIANYHISDCELQKNLIVTCKSSTFDMFEHIYQILEERGSNSPEDNPEILARASKHKDFRIIDYLLQSWDPEDEETQKAKNSALREAASRGDLEMVKFWADKGASVHCEEGEDNEPVCYAVEANSFETVDYLLEQGAQICDSALTRVLERAVECDNLEMVEFLLERDAVIDRELMHYAECTNQRIYLYLKQKFENIH
jgi:ankyrin repeat protein